MRCVTSPSGVPVFTPLSRTSSLGVFQRSPPSTSRHASGPGSVLSREPRLGEGDAAPPLLPLLPFFPAAAVFSAWSLAGLLHPAADPGVQPVRDAGRSRAWLPPSCLPFGAFLLFNQPYRVAAALVPSRRSRLVWPLDLPPARPQGLAPVKSPVHPGGLAASLRSDAPLGFFLRSGRSSTHARPLPPRHSTSLSSFAPTGSTVTLWGWGRWGGPAPVHRLARPRLTPPTTRRFRSRSPVSSALSLRRELDRSSAASSRERSVTGAAQRSVSRQSARRSPDPRSISSPRCLSVSHRSSRRQIDRKSVV